MKTMFGISAWLNLLLCGGLILVLAQQRKEKTIPVPVSPAPSPEQTAAPPPTTPEPFHWRQFESTKDYRIYIANLRAAGCPEATIADIVRGDAHRAYAWERNQLKLDGSGNGPWSQAQETQLVADLLGGRPSAAAMARSQDATGPAPMNGSDEVTAASVPTPGAGTAVSSYPLFLQNPNWSAMGFDSDDQAAIARVRQQFQDEVNRPDSEAGPNAAGVSSGNATLSGRSGGNAASLSRWQTALQNADDQLREALGAQGYMAYELQQYYTWYQPQVTANSGGENLSINPAAFSLR